MVAFAKSIRAAGVWESTTGTRWDFRILDHRRAESHFIDGDELVFPFRPDVAIEKVVGQAWLTSLRGAIGLVADDRISRIVWLEIADQLWAVEVAPHPAGAGLRLRWRFIC